MISTTAGWAAGWHGHEYSARRESPLVESNVIPRRHPLTRSTFSKPIPRRATTYDPYLPKVVERPQRSLSAYIPKTHEPTVRFLDPEADTMSEDGRSVANSEGSGTTTGGQTRRRRSLRTNTAFHFAHPAPTLTKRQKLLDIRPKLLLQLQKLSAESRPKPVIDVLPSTVVVPRLVKKFPRMFRGKGKLGANDVMIVRSEDYDAPDDHNAEDQHDSDQEGLGNRDLVAVICQLQKECGGSEGRAEIVLNDGRWVASPLPNKIYEFVSVDEMGTKTTARWVRKGNIRKSVDLGDVSGITEDSSRFTFSVLDPNARRHPIMATLTQTKLDLPDTYTISSSASKYPPTSPVRHTADHATEEELISERTTHTIDESLKVLIQVTAIWVALRQGWSPYFKYNDSLAATTTLATPGPSSRSRARSMSLTPEGARLAGLTTGASTPESAPGGFGAVVSSKIRQTCARGSPASAKASQFENATTPQRSVSAGTAFMARNAARRGGNTAISTVASDSEGENSFNLPRRAVTVGSLVSGPHLPATPSIGLSRSSVATPETPETPTRPQRRPQSTLIPSPTAQSHINVHAARHSVDAAGGRHSPEGTERIWRPRVGRWRTLLNIFRRTNVGSRNDG